MNRAIVVAAVLLVAGCAHGTRIGSPTAAASSLPSSEPPPTQLPSSMAADLRRTLDRLPMPPGAVRLAKPASGNQYGESSSNSPAKVSEIGYWRTTLDRAGTLSWLDHHLGPAWPGGAEGTSGGTTIEAEYGRPGTASIEGPELEVSIQDVPGGSSLIITAYEIPLPVKSAVETLAGVSGATVWTKEDVAPLSVTPLRTVTLPQDQAAQLAADVNALSTDDGSPRSCLAGIDDVVLDFTTAAGPRRFVFSQECSTVNLVPASGPALDPSAAFTGHVQSALAASVGAARGTLIVTLAIAGRPYTPASVAGTVAVQRAGRAVDRGSTSAGHLLIRTEPAGSYEVSGSSGRLPCPPMKVTVAPDQQVDITLVCAPHS